MMHVLKGNKNNMNRTEYALPAILPLSFLYKLITWFFIFFLLKAILKYLITQNETLIV